MQRDTDRVGSQNKEREKEISVGEGHQPQGGQQLRQFTESSFQFGVCVCVCLACPHFSSDDTW